MSLPRDSPPGSRISSFTQGAGDLKINGQFAIGFQDGKLYDQYIPNVMDQGLMSCFFKIERLNGSKIESAHLNMRLEPDRLHKKPGDVGINLYFNDTEFGKTNAYTYKKYSIDSALDYLAKFANDPNNSQHILYSYISQLSTILGALSGTTPLGTSSSKDAAKRAVLSNLSTLGNMVSFPSNQEIESLLKNYATDPNTFHSIENTIRIKLDLSTLDPQFSEPFDVVIDFNGTATSLINFRIENLPRQGKYAFFDIGIIQGYENGVFDPKKVALQGFELHIQNDLQLNNSDYLNLEELPLLIKLGINTTKSMIYHLKGTFSYKYIAGNNDYNLDFYIEISDKVNPDTGMLYVIAFILFDFPETRIYNAYHSEIYIKENTVYFKKVHDNSPRGSTTFEYFKCTSEEFVNDLIFYLCIYMIGSEKIYNLINDNKNSTPDMTPPLSLIKDFETRHNVKIDKNTTIADCFAIDIRGNVKFGLSFKINGSVYLAYDPITAKITGIYAHIGVAADIVNFTIKAGIVEDNPKERYNKIYNGFIEAFENPSNPTSKLPFRYNASLNPNDKSAVYEVTKPGKHENVGIGEIDWRVV